MTPYSHLKKAQLETILVEIEKLLQPAIVEAKTSSQKYSEDLLSQLAFEVGHLNGSIKGSLGYLDHYKRISTLGN